MDLGGLNFTIIGDWPAAIHECNCECQIQIDERANAEQREGLLTIFKGEAGPPWSMFKNTFSTYYEPQFVKYETKVDGANSSVKAGEFFHLEMESIKNPVTGAEAFSGIVLPQGLLYRESTPAPPARLSAPAAKSTKNTPARCRLFALPVAASSMSGP